MECSLIQIQNLQMRLLRCAFFF